MWVPTIHKVGLTNVVSVFESETFASHVGVLAQQVNFKVRQRLLSCQELWCVVKGATWGPVQAPNAHTTVSRQSTALVNTVPTR